MSDDSIWDTIEYAKDNPRAIWTPIEATHGKATPSSGQQRQSHEIARENASGSLQLKRAAA